VPVENPGHFLNHVSTSGAVNRITAKIPEQNPKRKAKELLLSKISGINSKNASCRKAYYKVPVTGMRGNNHDILLQFIREPAGNFPSCSFKKEFIDWPEH
jgi:hypothetical protein